MNTVKMGSACTGEKYFIFADFFTKMTKSGQRPGCGLLNDLLHWRISEIGCKLIFLSLCEKRAHDQR